MRAPNAAALFRALDPAPLPARELDEEVAAYLAARAAEARESRTHVAALEVHLEERSADVDDRTLADALGRAFARNAARSRSEFRLLMKEGRRSAAVSLTFVLLAVAAVTAIWRDPEDAPLWATGGLGVASWVLLWRPIEIFCYGWWPIRAQERLWRALAALPVRVRYGAPPP